MLYVPLWRMRWTLAIRMQGVTRVSPELCSPTPVPSGPDPVDNVPFDPVVAVLADKVLKRVAVTVLSIAEKGLSEIR